MSFCCESRARYLHSRAPAKPVTPSGIGVTSRRRMTCAQRAIWGFARSAGIRVRPQRRSRSKNRASRAHKSAQIPWIGNASARVSRFWVRRKTSSVKTPFARSAEYVTPQRIGGRVAPTKSGSAVSPEWLALTRISLDAEHAAHPGHDLRCAEGDGDAQDRGDAPAPGEDRK